MEQKYRKRFSDAEKVVILRIAPSDRLEGRQQEIWDARDGKLEAARAARAMRRKSSNTTLQSTFPDPENQGKSQE
ncbi:hypothetical protein SIID45300_01274 [Candidatus Magnetaquicoccaceae bacterium FCR-1]|uniref:Transposase n=1 Tax=Candidatus Magnetaquiglobus chichijimensis TaxID=3141448 RepID=A0ABQ0C7U6_9PROT